MRSRMSFAKPKLIFIQYIIGVNEINKMILFYFFKYFRKGIKNRDWSKGLKALFCHGMDNFYYLKVIWKNTSLK